MSKYPFRPGDLVTALVKYEVNDYPGNISKGYTYLVHDVIEDMISVKNLKNEYISYGWAADQFRHATINEAETVCKLYPKYTSTWLKPAVRGAATLERYVEVMTGKTAEPQFKWHKATIFTPHHGTLDEYGALLPPPHPIHDAINKRFDKPSDVLRWFHEIHMKEPK